MLTLAHAVAWHYQKCYTLTNGFIVLKVLITNGIIRVYISISNNQIRNNQKAYSSFTTYNLVN